MKQELIFSAFVIVISIVFFHSVFYLAGIAHTKKMCRENAAYHEFVPAYTRGCER